MADAHHTPSGWDSDTGGRDRGHDKLQVAFWEGLFQGHFRRPPDMDGKTLDRYRIVFEYPFTLEGRILGFADICDIWLSDRHTYYIIYEIKPVIGSVGGIVRQCRAIEAIARRTAVGGRHVLSTTAIAIPVVPFTDPKLPMLIKVMKDKNVHGWAEPEQAEEWLQWRRSMGERW